MSKQQHNEFWAKKNIHQFYIDLIHCMPNIVYWVDMNCKLQGCNIGFVNLLGLRTNKDFSGTPYEIMNNRLTWTEHRIEKIKLDDLNVLFSGQPLYEVEEEPISNAEGELVYYLSTRVPLFDVDKNVIGLVVVLVDMTVQKALQKELHLAEQPLESKPNVNRDKMKIPIRVLLVEDDEMVQVQEKSLFMALHCDVDIAKTSDEALALFSPGKYDLVIMDISLKETTGYIVSKELRKLEKKNVKRHTPIIALTKHKVENVEYDCHYYGMEGVMTKPLTKEQALQMIKRYVFNEDILVDGLRCT